MQTIALGGAVESLSAPERSNFAVITAEDASFRCRFDGGDPTGSGHLIPPGSVLYLEGWTEVDGFRAYGPGATLRISYSNRTRGMK